MSLFYKIYIFLMLLLVAILAGSGYVSYQREVAFFYTDMKNDEILLGRSLSGMVEHAWETSGAKKALELIQDANSREHLIAIRWVNLDSPSAGMDTPKVPLSLIDPVLRGAPVSLMIEEGGKRSRVTYVPVATDIYFHSAIELVEPLAPLEQYIRHSLLHLVIAALLILLASGVLLWFYFREWIHRPLVLFTEKSRKIGQGDLSADLLVKGRDEFASLGRTINAMCRDLAASLEAVRAESQRRIEAIEQLRHSERLATLGRLSAGMAHEIGTPLNVIAGHAKEIRSGRIESAEITEFAGIIEEQARRITGIMQNLLDFARRRKPQRSPQDMGKAVQQVLDMLRPAATRAGVAFTLIRREDIPPVPVDALQIQQVLINLVMNGIQAMNGGGRLEVELALADRSHPVTRTAARHYLALGIKDEGPGIPEEHLPHLFEPFFTTKEVGSGTGLGLSIAYGIIEEHGGWIEVENRPEGGACFTVFLPLDVTP